MQELTFEQVEDVNGGILPAIILVGVAASVIRGCERRDAAYVAEELCGEGNVKSISSDQIVCKD